MSEVKKLALGIVLVGIGLIMLMGSGGGFWPIVGGVLGLIGAVLIIRALISGKV